MQKFLHRFKSDEALMLAYGSGNAAAFDVLYGRYKDRLFGFIYKSVQNQAQVEDIAHDSWMAVIGAAANYTDNAAFKTWLFRIAHNKVIDYWRASQRQPASKQSSIHEFGIGVDGRADSGIGNGDVDPDSISSLGNSLEVERLAEEAHAEIARLPMDQQQAFLLQHQGFSLAEIAEISESKLETVKSRLRYASAKLRQSLGA